MIETLFTSFQLQQSVSHDGCELSVNCSTIRRLRKPASTIKESFICDSPLFVHWDGKVLPDLMGTDKVDRLPVLISGLNVSKLLVVPRLPAGIGEAIVGCLED